MFDDNEANFVASHYKIVSMEKCTGKGSGLDTEIAIWRTADQLKSINPDLKVLFYINLENAGLNCYYAYHEFMANPTWWLHDDAGNVINPSLPYPDFRVEACRDWFVNIPFNGTVANTNIDGILADGTGGQCPSGLGTQNCSSWRDGRDTVV